MSQKLSSNSRVTAGQVTAGTPLTSRRKPPCGLVLGLALLGTFAVFVTPNASARHGHDHFRNAGSCYDNNHDNYREEHFYARNPVSNYGGYGQVYYPQTYYPRHRSYYHDTSHLDYHRPSFRLHNDHLDYVPGHYDYHRTGHFDHH